MFAPREYADVDLEQQHISLNRVVGEKGGGGQARFIGTVCHLGQQ